VLRANTRKTLIMNTFKALAWIASGHLKARAERRTTSILNALPDEVQKDIGWKWSPNRRDRSVKPSLSWDIL
jgi:hypothetical protein